MKKLLAVGTFVAGATVGFTACGAIVVNKILKSDRHREGLAKVVTEKLDTWLYGEEKRDVYRSSRLGVSYNIHSDKKNDRHHASNSKVSYRSFYDKTGVKERDIEPIVFDTREEAEKVLKNIGEIIDTYITVSVADVCDLCNVMPEHTDNILGWTTTNGMEIIEFENCCELHLPKAKPINV